MSQCDLCGKERQTYQINLTVRNNHEKIMCCWSRKCIEKFQSMSRRTIAAEHEEETRQILREYP